MRQYGKALLQYRTAQQLNKKEDPLLSIWIQDLDKRIKNTQAQEAAAEAASQPSEAPTQQTNPEPAAAADLEGDS
jgi:hypothetical protein